MLINKSGITRALLTAALFARIQWTVVAAAGRILGVARVPVPEVNSVIGERRGEAEGEEGRGYDIDNHAIIVLHHAVKVEAVVGAVLGVLADDIERNQ